MGSKVLRQFKIDVQSLSLSRHTFDFDLNKAFFSSFEHSPIEVGDCSVVVVLEKKETMLSADISIKGTILLTCDRSLREFDFPVEVEKSVIFKYGEDWQELDDEMYEIPRNIDQLDVSSLLYEFVCLTVPMKKIHPDLMEDDSEDDEVVFSTESEKEEESKESDPRWEELKKLKNIN